MRKKNIMNHRKLPVVRNPIHFIRTILFFKLLFRNFIKKNKGIIIIDLVIYAYFIENLNKKNTNKIANILNIKIAFLHAIGRLLKTQEFLTMKLKQEIRN